MLEFRFSDMINDPALSPLDRQWVLHFQKAVDEFLSKNGGYTPDFSLFNMSSSIGLDISGLHKDGTMLYALWLTMLNALQPYITVAKDFKFPTVEDFVAAYPGYFQNESDYEKRYLWLSANWMNILFRMVSARKNKGLVLYVIPKLVEGWDAKYVTGSGQTKATANRVHIFEVEGNTTANQRGKAKGKKRTSTGESMSPRSVAPKQKKQRAARRDPVLYDAAPYLFQEPFGTVAQYREQRQPAPAPMTTRRRSEGSTDIEDLSLNEEVKSTFAAWQEATENFGLGLLNLSRDNSFMENGLAKNVDQQLTDPLDYQRGFTWTEIPVAPVPLNTGLPAWGDPLPVQQQPLAPFGSGVGIAGAAVPNGVVYPGGVDVSAGGAGMGAAGAVPVVSSLFPQAPVDSSALFSTCDDGTSTTSSSSKLNLEVGAIVPVAGLMDIFQGYK